MPRTAHHTENPAKAAAAKTPFFSGPAAPFFQAKPAEGQQEDKTGPESEQLLRMNEPAVQEAAGENNSTPFFGRSPFFAQTQSFSPVPIRQTTEAPAAKAATIRRTADESEIQWSTADAGAQVQRQPETDTLQREAAETEETVQRQESESSESPTEIQRQPDAEEAVQRRETGETGSDLQLMPDFGEGDGQVQREPDEEETVQRLESEMTEDPGDVQRQPAPETGIPAGTDAESAPAPAMNTPDNASAAPPPASAPAIVQANLKVGAPDDRYEREADEMAEKVQRMPQKQHALPREWNPGQTGIPMFQRSEDADAEPDIQAKSDGPAPALQRSADGGLSVSSNFSSRLQTTGGGAPLPPATQQHMEGAFGADFGSVRIHTDTEAAQLSSDIGARAFTHKNDIYFNSGEYNPGSQSGQFLLAHELTHTVQQGAAVKRQPTASEEPPQVQAGFLDSLGSLLGSVRDRVVRFIRNLPGYFLISVIIGSDPITGQTVERTGMNFLRGFLLMLPGGEAKYNQLRDEGALQNAAAWMDRQIAAIASLRSRFSDAYNRSRDSLSGWDLLDPGEAFDRITGYFAPVVRDAITYAGQLVTEVLTFLKDALLSRLVNFVRDRTRAYPLLQVLLGRDPITGEEVPQTMENIIRGFLMLTEAGEAYYNKMVETGVLARATAWMREQIRNLPTRDEVVGAFTRAWESLSFTDLVHPVDAFERIYNILADPVGRIINFVVNVAMEVLRLIKEALLSLLRRHANEIRGYRLMTVLLGRDPVTGEQVERNATNILSGFVELVAGPEQFRQIEESGAIARMVSWLEELVNRTGISFQMVVGLMMGIWNSVSIQDLVHPIDTFNRIVARFQDPINRVLTFIIEVIKKVIEIVLQLMNVPVDVIMQIIERAMAAYEIIKRDPIAFLMNLLRAIKQGFQQFFDNILTHLLGGLTGWLFGELEAAGVRPPTELSFRAILGFVLDVLGISMERIWQKLAEHPRIGPQRVARIRSIIDRLTGIWTIIQEVMNEGIGALWRHIEEQLSNLWTMVLDYVKNWVMEQIITQMVTRLLSMLDPTGIMAVIRSVEAFYRAVQSFIERLNEILRIVNSFVGGILEIAQGNLTTAANYLERTMAGALPTIIGFLANQIGLRGLGARIGEMIEQVRAVVDQALTWLINKVVDMGFALLDRVMGRTDAQGTDSVQSALHEIDSEGTQKSSDGDLSREDAEQIKTDVNRDHPSVIEISSVADGGETWDFSYVQRAIKKVSKTKKEPPALVKPSFSGNKASSFEVKYLKHDRLNGGSPPQADPLGWPEIQVANLSNQAAWVRMHLLSEILGGPGSKANLTPARGPDTNIRFRDSVEHPAHTAVTVNKDVIWYKVDISYHSSPHQNYASHIGMQWGIYKYNANSNAWDKKSVGFEGKGGQDSQNPEIPPFSGTEALNMNTAGRVRIQALDNSFTEPFARMVVEERTHNGGSFGNVNEMIDVLRERQPSSSAYSILRNLAAQGKITFT